MRKSHVCPDRRAVFFTDIIMEKAPTVNPSVPRSMYFTCFIDIAMEKGPKWKINDYMFFSHTSGRENLFLI